MIVQTPAKPILKVVQTIISMCDVGRHQVTSIHIPLVEVWQLDLCLLTYTTPTLLIYVLYAKLALPRARPA